jgi:hypothetical protein
MVDEEDAVPEENVQNADKANFVEKTEIFPPLYEFLRCCHGLIITRWVGMYNVRCICRLLFPGSFPRVGQCPARRPSRVSEKGPQPYIYGKSAF